MQMIRCYNDMKKVIFFFQLDTILFSLYQPAVMLRTNKYCNDL